MYINVYDHIKHVHFYTNHLPINWTFIQKKLAKTKDQLPPSNSYGLIFDNIRDQDQRLKYSKWLIPGNILNWPVIFHW